MLEQSLETQRQQSQAQMETLANLGVNPNHKNGGRFEDDLRHCGLLWMKLRTIFPEHDSEGPFVVPTIDFRAQVLNVFDRWYQVGMPVFRSAPSW